MKKTIAESVSDKIKKGEVRMRSRFSVLAEKLGTGGVGALFIAILVMVAGFILYWAGYNYDLLSGGYGLSGPLSFVQSFPYLPAAAFLIVLAALVFILRRYDFSYKKPLLFILAFVVAAVAALGYLWSRQPAGARFYQREGGYYRMGMMDNANAVSGIVVSVSQGGFSLQDLGGKTVQVAVTGTTHYPFGKPRAGDTVRTVGAWKGEVFEAFGVRVFGEAGQTTPFPGGMRRGGMMRGR